MHWYGLLKIQEKLIEEEERFVHNLIENIKNNKANFSRSDKFPYPATNQTMVDFAEQMNFNPELIDIIYVIIGEKPAALIQNRPKKDKSLRFTSYLLDIAAKKGYYFTYPDVFDAFLVVGEEDNVKEISEAIEDYKFGEIDNATYHRILGENLGYPSREVENFVERNSCKYFNFLKSSNNYFYKRWVLNYELVSVI